MQKKIIGFCRRAPEILSATGIIYISAMFFQGFRKIFPSEAATFPCQVPKYPPFRHVPFLIHGSPDTVLKQPLFP